jgi:hypothetical protein
MLPLELRSNSAARCDTLDLPEMAAAECSVRHTDAAKTGPHVVRPLGYNLN